MTQQIIVTETDANRLRPLLESAPLTQDCNRASLNRLKLELDRARIVGDTELPSDVIGMNSTVEVEDLTDGEVLTFTLVYPEQADIAEGRISILAPLGMAMLGYREGDEFEWPVPAGTMRVRVRKLINREAPLNSAA